MSKHMKKLLALLLALVMIVGLLPTVAFADEAREQTKNGNAWDRIYQYQDMRFHGKRALNKEITYEDYCAIAGELATVVMGSDDYLEGSCTYDPSSGNATFFWDSTDGEAYGYSPSLSAKLNGRKIVDPNTVDVSETISYATKGGSPTGGAKDVYVIGPWYGSDSSFTNQYKNEGQSIASATGGTYTLYATTSATVDNVASALQSGAVVIFDSHGVTDYDNKLSYKYGSDYVYDSVTQANTSYLTLTNNTGWTSADKASVTGTYGSYKHAWSFTASDNSTCYCVDGTAISNHMSGNAPHNMLWMAICLGMATNGLHAPLRNKGVEVVYGYSQSVSFNGDYEWESEFWSKMKTGESVATAFAYMTSQTGGYGAKWDYSNDSDTDTIGEARYYMSAFPNVVSSEDTYQGQRSTNPSSTTAANSTTYNASYGACNLQTVNSTWTLFSQYTVNATSNNTSYGTVSVNGTTITASPKSGYYASGYTVTSGTATVTQNGNIFEVTPESDCTIRINFAAKTACTLTYMANGSQYSTASGYAGDVFTLPTSATAVANWTFSGWATGTIAETTDKPEFYEPGASFTPTGNTTLYAVYTKTEGGGGTATYEKATSIAAGDKVVFVCEGASAEMTSVSTVGQYTEYSGSPAGTMVFDVLTGNSSGTFAFKNGDDYLNYSGSSNTLNTATSLSDATSWNVSINSSGDATITNAANSARQIWWNVGSPRFACYTGKTAGNSYYIIQLYKQGQSGTTYYTTSPVNCAHSNLTEHTAVPATCTTGGTNAYWSCDDCGALFSDNSATTSTTLAALATEALGHSYGAFTSNNNGTHSKTCSRCQDVVTESCTYTDSTSGTTVTHTCSVCNYSYSEQLATYTVTYNDRGTTTTETCVQGSSVTLPATASTVDGYTFAGWVAAEIDPESTAVPTVLTGSYTPTANVTLYACYTRTEAGSGSGGASGTKELTFDLTSTGESAMSNWPTAQSATATDCTYTLDNTAYTFTVTNGKFSSYVLFGKQGASVGMPAIEGYKLTSVNATSRSGASANVKVGISDSASTKNYIDGGDAVQWTPNTGNWTYTLTDTAANTMYYLYVDNAYNAQLTQLVLTYTGTGGSGSTTYYTTAPADPHVHTPAEAVQENVVPATCTVDGSYDSVVYCSDCNEELSRESVTIPKLGHDFSVDPDVTDVDHYVAPTCTNTGIKIMKCSRCNTFDEENMIEIPSLGHNYAAGTPVPATCTEDGYTIYTCSNCGDEDIRDIVNALGHNMVAGTVHEPTCTEEGYTEYACSRCNATDIDDFVDELGHDFSVDPDATDSEHYLAPTCTETGLKNMMCSRCGAFTDDLTEIPALGHDLSETAAVDPTCTAAGNSAYWTCNTCGKYFSDSNGDNEIAADSWIIPKLTETMQNTTSVGTSLTTEGDVLLNAYLIIPENLTENNDNLVVKLYTGAEVQEIPVNDNILTPSGFRFQILKPAKEMREEVTLELYNGTQLVQIEKDGVLVDSITYSVQGYLDYVIDNAAVFESAYPGIVNLCKAMSAYGSYAQVQQNYTHTIGNASYDPKDIDNTTASQIASVSADSTGKTLEYGGEEHAVGNLTKSGDLTGVKFYGASLIMESEMTVRFYFTVTYANVNELNAVVGGETVAFTRYGNSSYYYVDVTNIEAKDFGKSLSVEITNGTDSYTVSGYSVHRYIYLTLIDTQTTDEALANLVKAIAYYGFMAEIYYENNK